jgi:hypothetical protein
MHPHYPHRRNQPPLSSGRKISRLDDSAPSSFEHHNSHHTLSHSQSFGGHEHIPAVKPENASSTTLEAQNPPLVSQHHPHGNGPPARSYSLPDLLFHEGGLAGVPEALLEQCLEPVLQALTDLDGETLLDLKRRQDNHHNGPRLREGYVEAKRRLE